MAFAGATLSGNEFAGTVTFDSRVAAGVTYTRANRGLLVGGTLTVRNSAGGATGPTVLDSSASNLSVSADALTLGTFGGLNSRSSTITIAGNVNASAASAYIVMGASNWTVAGTWTNASTSASWSAGTSTVTFTSATGGTMTFAGSNLAGSEFYNVAFASSAASAQTVTMSTRALRWNGTLTVS